MFCDLIQWQLLNLFTDMCFLSYVHVYRIEYVSYRQGPYRIRIVSAADRIVPALFNTYVEMAVCIILQRPFPQIMCITFWKKAVFILLIPFQLTQVTCFRFETTLLKYYQLNISNIELKSRKLVKTLFLMSLFMVTIAIACVFVGAFMSFRHISSLNM